MDIDRQAKGLGLKASFLQFAATGKDGRRHTRRPSTWNWRSKTRKSRSTCKATAAPQRNGTAGGDKTMNLDMVRQTKGLSLKASLVQFAPLGDNGQTKTSERWK